MSREVEQKNEKISELHNQLRDSIRASKITAPSSERHIPHGGSNVDRDRRLGLFEFDDDDVDLPDLSGLTSKSRESEVKRSDCMNDRGSAVGQSGPMTSTQRQRSSMTNAITNSTQTDQPGSNGSHDNSTPELLHIRSKLQDTERLNSALRAELEIYKSVLGDGDITSSKGERGW